MEKAKEFVSNATWERELKLICCEICVKEVEMGNRPITFFNKEGWQNIAINFKQRTNREYAKVQLKNKWDQLKKDWKLWKELKRGSTGLGWDHKKTIDAPDEWWKEKLEVVPNAKKFRFVGIDPELEAKLDIMFDGVTATGESSWTPLDPSAQELTLDLPPEHTDTSNDIPSETIHVVENHTESSHCIRESYLRPRASKKRKSGSTYLKSQITQLVSACAAMPPEVSITSTPTVSPTIGDAIKVLDSMPELYEDMPLYLNSTKILEDSNKREVFMYMLPERRVHYLRFLMGGGNSP